MRLRALVLVISCAAPLAGCDVQFGSGQRATLTYTEDARAAYGEAMKAFRNRDWEDAKALFNEVKRLFSYTRYARLSELRIADIDFEQEKFPEAVTGYREFVQNHKNDPEVEYARYKTTKALFKDIDDTILLPPAEERDQGTLNDAYKEIRSYLRDYPKSRYIVDETYMLDIVSARLMRHQLYVARYYLRSDNFPAAVARMDYAVKTYPGSKLEPEALVLKGETLMKMKKFDEARDVFEKIKRDYGGPFAKPAQGFLDEIAAKQAKGKAK